MDEIIYLTTNQVIREEPTLKTSCMQVKHLSKEQFSLLGMILF